MFDAYFLNITNMQFGKGIFESIDLYGDILPPPPVGSGYRIATDGKTRVLTISTTSERVTTTF